MSKRGKLIVLSGPGGVGKSTIVSKLIDNTNFFFSVSATTRKPRAGEVDGRSYHFIDDKSFDELISKNLLLEWAEFAGARYGSIKAPIDQALSEGKNVLLEIEIQGARQVKAAMPEATLVFLQPPSFQELEARIVNRGTDSPERIAARLDLARSEMAAAKEFEHILVNHRVEDVLEALLSLATS
jgi:guanylate kinase